jgi:cyclopropane fatty-acyl-phospholipid synthase-like methyltransferase
MRVLEQNGFKLMRMQNLRAQYSKTITAWYERFMLHKEVMQAEMGEPTFRAWRLYLGGGAGIHSGDVNRLYCVAI